MRLQGSNLNKPGSKYSLGPVLYNLVLFKTGATYLPVEIILNHSKCTGTTNNPTNNPSMLGFGAIEIAYRA